MSDPFQLPASRDEIRATQSRLKRAAFERAKQAKWYRGRLDRINPDHLDEPEEWAKIPILDKETLRQWSHQEFMEQICIAPQTEIVEYWRSGGSTGQPVFYPRTREDVENGMLSWRRSFGCTDIGPGDLCHICFPIGIHPAGQIWARSAMGAGVGMLWVGAGNAVPSRAQLDLIQNIKPTVLIGMPGFALHLSNIADMEGIDLSASSVTKMITSAEPLSAAKREKLERTWGAEVYDVFGMSEAGLMGSEGRAHDGIHIWSDMYFIEVVDEATGEILPEGETGAFLVTPLLTGNATPFLRWNSGDIVTMHGQGTSGHVYADLFPMIRHAHRTAGFFKVRGVNVNHTEFEDFMFADPKVNDFQVVLKTGDSGLEDMIVRLELKRGTDADGAVGDLTTRIRNTFEVTVETELLPAGEIGRDFEKFMKAPRFVDERGN
jgi:phenylacetate-CoA ligase